ncbi:MAG: glutathione S-transferase N-terminal domain-containing protein [Hyphomicrobiales bacterium]|nr:glutathione S-transferase N-terminal domain-containing protein [Hyphomicrobiales bacterium]MCP5370263.1 glutathione S-transferase N-terminal domain-containing protein [Hyphomicrobiales bacterium]
MPLVFHALPISGNCLKVRLLLSMLEVPFEERTVTPQVGGTRTPEFLAINPLGHVPVIEDTAEDGRRIVIRDSQAILVYLARRHDADGTWYPLDAVAAGQVQQWLSFAANEMWHGPALARAFFRFGRELDIAATQTAARRVLGLIDDHLAGRDWLECGHPTVADLAVFPYAGLAHEGQVDLAPYRRLRAWVDRVKALPGYVGIEGL